MIQSMFPMGSDGSTTYRQLPPLQPPGGVPFLLQSMKAWAYVQKWSGYVQMPAGEYSEKKLLQSINNVQNLSGYVQKPSGEYSDQKQCPRACWKKDRPWVLQSMLKSVAESTPVPRHLAAMPRQEAATARGRIGHG